MVKKLPKCKGENPKMSFKNKVIDDKFSKLLSTFKTNELDIETIDEEVELVRERIYKNI